MCESTTTTKQSLNMIRGLFMRHRQGCRVSCGLLLGLARGFEPLCTVHHRMDAGWVEGGEGCCLIRLSGALTLYGLVRVLFWTCLLFASASGRDPWPFVCKSFSFVCVRLLVRTYRVVCAELVVVQYTRHRSASGWMVIISCFWLIHPRLSGSSSRDFGCVQLATSRIGNLTRLNPYSCYMCDHTCRRPDSHTYTCFFFFSSFCFFGGGAFSRAFLYNYGLTKSARMKEHFVYGRLRSDRNHFRGSRIP